MPKHREKLEDKVLYVICEENCFTITRLQCEKVSDLTSTQEEADTQIHFVQQMLAIML